MAAIRRPRIQSAASFFPPSPDGSPESSPNRYPLSSYNPAGLPYRSPWTASLIESEVINRLSFPGAQVVECEISVAVYRGLGDCGTPLAALLDEELPYRPPCHLALLVHSRMGFGERKPRDEEDARRYQIEGSKYLYDEGFDFIVPLHSDPLQTFVGTVVIGSVLMGMEDVVADEAKRIMIYNRGSEADDFDSQTWVYHLTQRLRQLGLVDSHFDRRAIWEQLDELCRELTGISFVQSNLDWDKVELRVAEDLKTKA